MAENIYYTPAKDEYELFYSYNSRESDCVGYLRGYFEDDRFRTQWDPHDGEYIVSLRQFADECNVLMAELRKGALSSPGNAEAAARRGSRLEEGWGYAFYGHKLQTEHYDFYLRIPVPVGGNYIYIYCYKRKDV